MVSLQPTEMTLVELRFSTMELTPSEWAMNFWHPGRFEETLSGLQSHTLRRLSCPPVTTYCPEEWISKASQSVR